MPVNFLSNEKLEVYGRFAQPPSEAQLAQYFYLDERERQHIFSRRSDPNRLGFAIQLTTVRFLGTFLEDPLDVPPNVLLYLAQQLELAPMPDMTAYRTGETRWDHRQTITESYAYHSFSEPAVCFRFTRWLYTRTWYTAERPSILFDLATGWLIEQKILLPGATVLARFLAQIRERTDRRLWHRLASLLDISQQNNLLRLLDSSEDGQTRFDVLKTTPTRISGPGLVEALHRLLAIRDLGIHQIDLAPLPPNRIQGLAEYAMRTWAGTLHQIHPERRLATLLAFVHVLEATAQDDVLDLFDQILWKVFRKAIRTGEKERLRTLRDLDDAAQQLQQVGEIVLSDAYPDPELRQVIFSVISPDQLKWAVQMVQALTRSPDSDYYERLANQYGAARRYLPKLLQAVDFQGLPNTAPIREALEFLRQYDANPKLDFQDAPRQVIPRRWRHLVIDKNGLLHKGFYTFCVLQQLQDGLRRRDIFVSPSSKWNDPREKLFQGHTWEMMRPQVCRVLNLPVDAATTLSQLAHQLETAYHHTLQYLPQNPAARIEVQEGKPRLVVSGLDVLPLGPSYHELRSQVIEMIPQIDLPEMMLEIHARTGFADAFTHLSEHQTQVEDLHISLCAVLLAEACNIGLEPLIQPHIPALTRGRLQWVQQNFIRAETLARANAYLVDTQSYIPLARLWGGGEVASADGLRFSVPVETLHAETNQRYFGVGRGVTFLNFTSDQFTGFHGVVIPGAVREALYILDGLLEQKSSLVPIELMTDTAGYTDVAFGLFWLLGFQFSPRIADIGSTRFWRIDPRADYGMFNAISNNKIRPRFFVDHWDDLLRIAGSLKFGRLSASDLMRTFRTSKRPSSLTRAVQEVGRIAKTRLHS